MCASGFSIIKDQTETGLVNGIVFSSILGVFSFVTNNGGKAQFNTLSDFGVKLGDVIQIIDGIYITFNAVVISIESPTAFTMDLDFVGDDGSIFLVNDFITFEDTPENLLREVQVQILTSADTIVSITFDGGDNYIPLNDNQPINGLATFTFFVEKESIVNFISSEAVTITITVGVS